MSAGVAGNSKYSLNSVESEVSIFIGAKFSISWLYLRIARPLLAVRSITNLYEPVCLTESAFDR